jgi:hypothetical protein
MGFIVQKEKTVTTILAIICKIYFFRKTRRAGQNLPFCFLYVVFNEDEEGSIHRITQMGNRITTNRPNNSDLSIFSPKKRAHLGTMGTTPG